ncbi:MAG TPA: histidinol phosphatase [Blastocatellia bacterium]|nr:histidinol phosphatase [Blastocatellia bacterium]
MKTLLASGLISAMLLATTAADLGQSVPRLGPGRKYTTIERLDIERLRAVHLDRLRYAQERRAVRLRTGYADYRAILHAHADDSAHTGGTRPELLAAARRVGVRIIMLTDHVRPERDFINDSWRGLREGVLFIPGAESEGFLVFPMASVRGREWKSKDEYVRLIRESGGNIFLSHVEERLDYPASELDGLEIYNHHSDTKDEAEFSLWLRGAFSDPVRLKQLERALSEYPEEVFSAQQDYLSPIIAKWDRDTQLRRLTGVAANDCHHNQVFTVAVADENAIEVGYIGSRPTNIRVTASQAPGVAELVRGRKPGELIARLDFDPYERSLTYVTTHVLAKELSEPAVRDALRRGHAYVAHDWLRDATGFAFVASRGGKLTGTMGDEVPAGGGLVLEAATPVACRLKLIRNGAVVKDVTGSRLDHRADGAGVYRVEAWLSIDGELRPWIYSNPIYVR